MQSFREISKCRVCGNRELIPILSLGSLFVSNFVDSPNVKMIKAPLELVLCEGKNACSMLQLKHTVEEGLMYRNYWYRSGMNRSMAEALADIAEKAEHLVKLKSHEIVLDIGCNDGTLLRSFAGKNIKKFGFEPAINLIPYAEKETTKIINDFFNFEAFRKNFGKEKAKIITSIAMFYDLDDPNRFVEDIKKCLDKHGVWIIEMHYLSSMLSQNAFDAICHEHLEYYSLTSLENLLEKHSLEVVDVELNKVNGGSFRTYIRHKGSAVKPFDGAEQRVRKLREFEKGLELTKKGVYQQFAERVNKLKEQVVGFIRAETAKGKKVFVYGASTKGNTLLQYFGLNNKLIKAAAERNPDKWGKKTVGTLIPIISEEQARAEKPDYFLVLPWHFLKEFKEREKSFLQAGGRFIVPLPELTVVGFEE